MSNRLIEVLKQRMLDEQKVTPEYRDVGEALAQILAEATTPEKAKESIRAAFGYLEHEVYFTEPSKPHIVIGLKTPRGTDKEINLGNIYLPGRFSENQKRDLDYLTQVAARGMAKIELSERYQKMLAFKQEMAQALNHDVGNQANLLSMATNILREDLERISASSKETIEENLSRAVAHVEMIGSAGNKVHNMMEMLKLDGSSEEITRENPKKFSYVGRIKEIMDEERYQIEKHNLGFRLYYPGNLKALKLYTNLPVFSSIFANLIENAVDYALPETTVSALLGEANDGITFEIENNIAEVVDEKEVRNLLKRGYRGKRKSIEERTKRNEGIGLYLINEGVKKYSGELSIVSSNTPNISINRIAGLETKFFGATGKTTDKPYFYTRISIPLDNLR